MKFYENPLPLPPTNVATPPLLLGRLATREPLAPSPRHAHRRGHRPLAPSPRLAAVSIAYPTAGRLLPLVSLLLFFLTRSSRWKESPFLQARDLPTPATALPRASSGSGEAPIRRGDGYAALQLGREFASKRMGLNRTVVFRGSKNTATRFKLIRMRGATRLVRSRNGPSVRYAGISPIRGSNSVPAVS
ncbi:uncharacterized protein LOC123400173 [Hordeum vulgare subsp. vulgare]|uniref:uncharacterized protein LOC123400173 n=1 Tax=Hordeum vulgare subsp. vulgare TaxID=112509 RepID=UPI001D1A402F|nr:uncharacterized protein LOC123400173 [Hordeum vulgare subsp. vulgare]